MKIFIDSNLLIYLNTISNTHIRVLYEDFYIDLLSKYKAYTDVLVLDELLYLSEKKYSIPYKVTLEFIKSIVLPYVLILGLGEEEFNLSIKYLKKYELKPSDALHLGVMEKNDISIIASEDRGFDKVDGIRRVWLDEHVQ